ncbi:MAG TPA: RNA polymerase sigma factor [Solirubrobacteraceae bacterium]|jgi:RNA polymerase sigma-70 factor (ECF subfamily)
MAPSPYAGRSDADLLWSTAEDPEAFGAFYDRYEGLLLAFFVRATGRGELAVDLAAETFAAALESVQGFRPALGSAKGWLFGIARHHLADTWRRGAVEDSARRRLGMQPLALEDEAFEAIEELGGRDGADALALLGQLPLDQCEAIRGRVLGERDYAELARELECSQSVARQRVSRGLRTLRARIEGAS